MHSRTEDHCAVKTRATLAAALPILLLLLPVLLRPGEFVQDDSYFYLEVADHLRAGEGSTFHGITPTNGYHPLWMAGAVLAVSLAGGDRELALYVVVAIQVLLALGCAVLFVRLARSMECRHPLPGLAVILIYLLGAGLYGSEAHLNALLLAAGLLVLWRTLGDPRPHRWFETGLLFGLAILARLDNLFIVAALCGLGLLYGRAAGWPALFGCAAATAAGGALVVAPYLAWNAIEYGHLVPVSGAIKSTFPVFAFDLDRLGAMGKLAAPFGLLALAIGGWLDRASRRRVLWLGLGAGVVLHAVYVAGYTDHYTFWAWYYVSGVLTAALCIAWLPGWLGARLAPRAAERLLGPAMFVLALALLTAGAGRAWLKAWNPLRLGPLTIDIPVNEYRWPEEFARWLKTELPPGTRLFTYDWPGALAWYSGLSVLPMDGLMSDFAYNDALLATGAERWLCAHGVRYYFGLTDEEGGTVVEVEAPLYRRPAGRMEFRPDALVARVQDIVSRPAAALPFALWRLDCPET